MEEKLFDVLGIGAYCIDYLCLVEGYPLEDEKREALQIEVQGGGNVATACVCVSRLGGKACYHGVIGKDENTDTILDELDKDGVDIQYIDIKEGKTPLSFIIINRENSSRTIVYSQRQIPPFNPSDLNCELVMSCKVLLIDFYHEEASLKASIVARESGIPVVVDAERVTSLSHDIMRKATHIIASLNFATEFTGDSLDTDIKTILGKLLKKTVSPFVCITLGKRGAIFFDREKDRVIFQEAYDVDVADTTGAGDVFHGAYSFFLSKGYSIDEILRYSSACSALKCTKIGGRRGIPTMDELKMFLDKYG